jgi:hypothetical protein|tara:strand:+ start:1754 stop:2008 length:255 start_codon:yes stop_codon:yes gene_type:complete
MKLLVEIDHDFDIENFNKSARCMKCARQLFGDSKQQEQWALYAWQQWQDHNIPPEISRNKRCPTWAKSLEVIERRRKTKLRYYP